jgi:hypothetical protein
MTPEQNQIDLVRRYLEKTREAIRRIGIYTRSVDKNIFDHVVFGLLSKAFSLADAALLLVENDHPDEAFGLARSLVECAFNLRYLTQDSDQNAPRAWTFAEWFFKERQYWLYQAKAFLTDPVIIAELDKYAKENAITADPRAASGHWSGLAHFVWEVTVMDHPLDGSTYPTLHRKIEFATNYHETSAYVHCSFAAIDGILPDELAIYDPRWKSTGREQEGQRTLFTIVQYVYHAVRYALFGMKHEDTVEVSTLFGYTLAQLQPIRRLHKA